MNQSKPFKRDNNPMKRGIVIAGLAAGAVGILAAVFWSGDRGEGTAVAVAVKVPASLSVKAQTGKSVFDENCAVCHGANGAGSDTGPPLIHRIYEPNHHADYSFVLAVNNGVRGHHWPFGNMPPVPGVSESEVVSIVSYVRELQRANGIE